MQKSASIKRILRHFNKDDHEISQEFIKDWTYRMNRKNGNSSSGASAKLRAEIWRKFQAKRERIANSPGGWEAVRKRAETKDPVALEAAAERLREYQRARAAAGGTSKFTKNPKTGTPVAGPNNQTATAARRTAASSPAVSRPAGAWSTGQQALVAGSAGMGVGNLAGGWYGNSAGFDAGKAEGDARGYKATTDMAAKSIADYRSNVLNKLNTQQSSLWSRLGNAVNPTDYSQSII